MPRKLLSDCYRGWYGWEGHNSFMLRMGNNSLWDCKHKLDQEKFRHDLQMERLQHIQKMEEQQSRKVFRSVQDEYCRIRAEQRVLQHHAFRKYDLTRGPDPLPLPANHNSATFIPRTDRVAVMTSSVKGHQVKGNCLPNLRPSAACFLVDSKGKAQDSKNKAQDSKGKAQDSKNKAQESKGKAQDSKSTARGRQLPTVGNKARTGRGAGATIEGTCVEKSRRTRTPTTHGKRSVFLTQSQLLASTVEEGEGEGEDEVFYRNEDPSLPFTPNNKVTEWRSEGPAVEIPMVQPVEVTLDRTGKDPQPDSFQSIDYILGARKTSPNGSGILTSPHLAKPSTPNTATKPSSSTLSVRDFASKETSDLSHDASVLQSVDTTPTEEPHPVVAEPAVQRPRRHENLTKDTTREHVSNPGVVSSRGLKGPSKAAGGSHQDTVDTAKESSRATHNRAERLPLTERSQSTAQPQAAFPNNTPSSAVSKNTPSSKAGAPELDGHRPEFAVDAQSAAGAPSLPGEQTENAEHQKVSLLSRFRQAAEVIVEEQRYERETNVNMFAALLLNRPQQQPRHRAIEKPTGVQEQERQELWQELLLNVQHAVRWRAKTLREKHGIPNTRQLRRRAKEEQQLRERARRHVFPGQCKTSYAMKKFLSREVEQLLEAWQPENRRKHRNRQLAEMASLPHFVDRTRSTTAILRDFKQFQSRREKLQV